MAISGFVISYNRAALLGTCLRSLRFCDELIVVDKSSTDHSARLARRIADRVIQVPWSPTVEETRSFALEQCRYDRIAFLDDDEMLSPDAIAYLHGLRDAEAPSALALPLRHWILGTFRPEAYYWPEHQIRFFRRGAITFAPIVHGGIRVHADHVEQVPVGSSIFIEHLSHANAEQWIERTNRYTSRPQRVQADDQGPDLVAFAHARIDHWLAQSKQSDRTDYPAAVALLRAVYDIVDRVKSWEAKHGLGGAAAFRDRCTELGRAYDELEARHGIRTGARGGLRRLLPAYLTPRVRWRHSNGR
jgi:glycosyltransferase involved in cell wall biosynthesis